MSDVKEVRNADVVGAIRMALVGTDDQAAALTVIAKLCEYAPETPSEATGPTSLFLDAIRDVKGRLVPAAARPTSETPGA